MADNLQFQISVQGIQGTVSDLKGLDAAIKTLTASMKTVGLGTQQFTERLNELRGAQALRTQLLTTNTAIQGTQTASANASMALLNLNYVIRDSPYFFNNFALGLLAVGNNLNPLIDSFTRLRMEAGDKAISTFALLRQALVGGAGISIAFSVAVTAIQAFVFQMAKAKRETGETAKEIDLLSEALKRFVKVDMPSGKTMFSINPEDLKAVISETKKQLDDINASLTAIGMKKSYGSNSWNDNVEKATKEAEKNRTELEKTKKILEEDLKIYQNELRAREILGKLGLEETERQKEKTKELQKQKEFLAGQRPLLMQIVETIRQYQSQLALIGLGGGASGTSGGGLRPSGGVQPRTNPFLETLQQIDKELKEEFSPMMKAVSQVANLLGNAISNAFLSGKNAINAATQALAEFIVQLLIIQGLMGIVSVVTGGAFGAGFLSGPLGFLGGSGAVGANGVLPKSNMMGGGGQSLNITGQIEARQDKFVIDFKKAEYKLRRLQT